jgi:hypothetical protein
MHTFADYLFLAAIIAPPMVLAAFFLYFVSPRHQDKVARPQAAVAKAH